MKTNDWRYETAQDLDQTIAQRLRRFPREPDMLVYGLRGLAALGLRAWLRVYHHLEVIGRKHLPTEGSYVLVSNHASHLDTLSLLSALPIKKLHHAFPAAAADYFFTSVPRIAIAAVVVNALPFYREVHIRQSLHLCKQVLANPGNILILFPEGTRSTTGEIGVFKPGVGLLLAGTDVPVLPCHIDGAFDAWPKGRILPRPSRLRLMIGAPRSYAALPPGKGSALQICHELREAVLDLAAMHRMSR
ncbi:MAG: lysophospholipid acyltransferase family protein [Candidatus Methylomirabilales bacterium]